MKHSTSETGAWTTRRSLALLGNIVFWIVVAIDVWYIWPSILGGSSSFVVVSGSSMEPTYFGGDLVIARKMEPQVGDVIVYAPTELGGAQIVHRIIGGNGEDGWVLQGDNNNFIDPFEPKADEVKGVVLVHYSDLGRLTALLLNPIFWAAFLLAGLVIYIWYSGDDCDDGDEDEDDAAASEGDPDADASEGAADSGESSGGDEVPQDAPAPVLVRARRSVVSRFAPGLRAVAFLGAAIVVLGIGVSPAAASRLTVIPASAPAAYELNACGDPAPAWGSTTTAAGATSNQVTVSNIPVGCRNKPFTVTVHNASGAVIATMTGMPTAASHSFTMPLGTYTVAQVSKVVVRVGGWVFPTTWSWTPPAPTDPGPGECWGMLHSNGQRVTGTTCVATFTPGSLQSVDAHNGGPGNFRDIQIATAFNPSSYVLNGVYQGEFHAMTRWRVTIDLTQTAYSQGINLTGPVYIYTVQNTSLAPGETCDNLASITLQEAAVGNNPSGGITVSSSPINWKVAGSLLCVKP